MDRQITITAGKVSATGSLNTSRTADAIWNVLPITATANTWGDEVYFSIPVKVALQNGKETVSLGDLGYWPPGTALCIFFGRTPVSKGNEIRPASAVSIFGRLDGDPTAFRAVGDGDKVVVERAEGDQIEGEEPWKSRG